MPAKAFPSFQVSTTNPMACRHCRFRISKSFPSSLFPCIRLLLSLVTGRDQGARPTGGHPERSDGKGMKGKRPPSAGSRDLVKRRNAHTIDFVRILETLRSTVVRGRSKPSFLSSLGERFMDGVGIREERLCPFPVIIDVLSSTEPSSRHPWFIPIGMKPR